MNKRLLFTLITSLFLFTCADEAEEDIELLNALELVDYNDISSFDDTLIISFEDTLEFSIPKKAFNRINDVTINSDSSHNEKNDSHKNVNKFHDSDLKKNVDSEVDDYNLINDYINNFETNNTPFDFFTDRVNDEIEKKSVNVSSDPALTKSSSKTVSNLLENSNKTVSNTEQFIEMDTVYLDAVEIRFSPKNNPSIINKQNFLADVQSLKPPNKVVEEKIKTNRLDKTNFNAPEENSSLKNKELLATNAKNSKKYQITETINKKIAKKGRAYKIDTVYLDELEIASSRAKEKINSTNFDLDKKLENVNIKKRTISRSTINSKTFSSSDRTYQSGKSSPKNDEQNPSLSNINVNLPSINYPEDNLILASQEVNDEPYKNEKSNFRTNFEEVKVTPFFTNPQAHNKQPKKKKQISPLKEKVTKVGVVQTNYKTSKQISVNTQAKPAIKYNIVKNQSEPRKTTLIKGARNNDFEVKLLGKQKTFETNKKHTVLLEVKNYGLFIDPIRLEPELPDDWKIISVSDLGSLDAGEKKFCLVSFYIPTESTPGIINTTFILKTNNYIIQAFDFDLKVENNYELEVFNVSAPQQLEAGETIEAFYGIRNNGNVSQEISLTSRNTINGESSMLIPKDSTIIVKIEQKTNPKSNAFKKLSTNLDVLSIASGKMYYSSKTVEVIPTKIAQKDPFLRFPVRASLYYSSYTTEFDHYSTISAELKGSGYLDEERDHYLNFTIRAPKKEDLRRFSIVDQYSLVYKLKNKATLYLGDHSYFINRLGFGSRYGMGFKLDYNINKWRLSAFYSKPRLYNYRSKALYGARADYFINDSQNIGITLERSQGNVYTYRNIYNENGKGQILTLDYDYQDDNTFIEAELSTSFNGKKTDYASSFNFSQNVKDFRYSSYLLYASKNYIGIVSNSIQLTNSLYYNKKSFNVGFGHSFSQVNRRLDPVLFETEPYYENYFASLGYRFSGKHYLNFRFDKRTREDQLEPKNYHYDEYGFNYNFIYTDKLFTGSFGGRFAKTQNLLTGTPDYKNTYSHHLNVSYKLFKDFNLRGGLNHIYTGRYGRTDESLNFVRYNLGFNYKVSKWLRVNSNFNSGFSPEENYKQRDYINFNLVAQINKRHRFEARANYFERPGVINDKELYAYGKYTYAFGVPIKRILDQGGVDGAIFTNNNDIDISGVKLYTAGKTIVTDRYGDFEFNNLPIGTNYVFIDDSSLPLNVVSKIKNPIEVVIESDRKIDLNIELIRAGSLYGNLILNNRDRAIHTNLESYVKLENENFTYYTESDSMGKFKFQNIVPGEYKFTVMRFKKNDKYFKLLKDQNIIINTETSTQLEIDVTGKERKIKFKNSNLKVVYND